MLSLWLSLLLTAEPPTALVTACTKGTARSCYELGLWHLDAAHRDDRRALAALGDGCRRGSAEACNSAGVLLNDSEVLARDPETTETWLRQACDRGLPLGCSNAALFVRIQGGDASALERRAYELAEKACAAGDATSCRVQYELVTRLDPAPMTTEQRTQFAARACNRGADWACGALAYSLWALESAARNPEEALRLSRGPCERNEPLACGVVAADALERKDDAAAAAPAAIACDGGLMEFCEVRGVFLLEGRGGLTKNAARGVELVERTCLAGGASACRYLLGRRALVPAGRVAALERALCESGDAAQCRALLSRGGLSPAVRTTAQGVLCEAEHQVAACEAFAQTLDAERRSPARAQAARVIACQGGSRPACRAALATETAPTARLPLLERLCHPPDELAACREWVTLRRTTPGATPRELLAATVLACVTAQECATLEDDIARARVAERAATFSLLEEACARPDGLRVCAPALAQAKLSGANTTIFEATLCEAGDGAACEARGAALRTATPARAVWFSA
ncbi:MAG: tetratricopeptide repeat protein, partial [Myxococcota bacterium]